jgi:hypothetical protein
MFEPTIALSRLVVTKGGVRAYDETFHLGFNVIRGENGSGKTTIADFIFFGLGGDTPQWRAEAALCDYVYAEVQINGEKVTFRRQIESEKLRPMNIFWGDFEKAAASQTEWKIFPYAGTGTKESFSQVIFTAAGIPEVKGELSAKVTMHQMLRLVYVDQKTDYDQVFRADLFDKALTREAVGDLLCGIYDDELYTAESELAAKHAERLALQSELKTILSLLGDQAAPSVEWLEQEKASRSNEREKAYSGLESLRTRTTGAVETIASRREQLAQELASLNQQVRAAEDRIRQSRVDLADREQFLLALNERLRALNESQTVHDRLGALSFQVCPVCYAPLSAQDGVCHLCKSPGDGRSGQNLLRLRHELEQQIRESKAMQDQIGSETAALAEGLRPLHDRQKQLQLEYDELSTIPHASLDAAAAKLYREIGYIDRTIEDLEQRSKFAARISAITDLQAALASEISRLNDQIAFGRVRQEQTKKDVSDLISDLTVAILTRDVPREKAFQEATRVTFDFGMNKISVDGRSNFAASSNVFFKNAFHAALWQASTLRQYMRYPRLVIFDNVEDKGMEPERSHNFQRIVRELSDTTECEHQMILFTSMVAPEFEDVPEILVGPRYTHDSKSLQFSLSTP